MIRFRYPNLVSLLSAATLFACSAATTGDTGNGAGNNPQGGGAQTVTVSVLPETADVIPGGTIAFASQVTGTIDTSVVWSVVEAAGGSVSSTGVYVAPAQAGTFHVRVASTASPSVFALATVTVTPTPTVGVAINPRTATVAASGTLSLSAIVTGTSDTRVTWSLRETSGCGTITNGNYVAPAAAATCHVIATSVADTTKSDTATITVSAPPPPVTVSIAPTSAALDACRTQTFTATVTGTSDTAVTWSVAEGAAGGTVSASGVYTAPAGGGTYHVVATSHASPSSTARVAVTVTERVLSVAVAPTSVSLQAGQTAQFTATVTTTCGAFATVQSVTAPLN